MTAPVFVTVAAVNYLASVLTLAQSLHRRVAGARLCALISDASPELLQRIRDQFGQSLEFIGSHDLNNPVLESMRSYYSILEFNSACKVWALDYLLRSRPGSDCIFVDPDTYASGDLAAGLATGSHDIALTAHAFHPYPDDGELPCEQELALAGHFNGGFIHARNTPTSREVLAWMLHHTRYNWFVAPTYGMYADQQWLGLLPIFFEKTAGVLKDPGINIAYWNLHERPLRKVDGQIMIADHGLHHQAKLFHFSGLAIPSNGRLTRHSNRRFDQNTEAILAELIGTYEKEVCGHMNTIRKANLTGDLGFSTKPLITRMKLAQARWGIRHIELAPSGPLARLGRSLDAFLK